MFDYLVFFSPWGETHKDSHWSYGLTSLTALRMLTKSTEKEI